MSFEIENGVLKKYTGTDEYVVIPNNVVEIGENAFSGCNNIITIDIPNTVTSIGNSAFSGCYNLLSIKIPYSVNFSIYFFASCATIMQGDLL